MERVNAEPQDLPCAHILGLLCRVGWYQYSTSSLNNGSTYLKLRVSCWALLRWAQPALLLCCSPSMCPVADSVCCLGGLG